MGLKIIANYFTLLFFWSAMTMLLLGSVPAFHFIPDRKNREMPFQSGLKTLACANEALIVAQEAVL